LAVLYGRTLAKRLAKAMRFAGKGGGWQLGARGDQVAGGSSRLDPYGLGNGSISTVRWCRDKGVCGNRREIKEEGLFMQIKKRPEAVRG
jgi:hypothetical protein